MVFPAYHAAVFIHGCFWHGHDCRFFRLPDTRREFWERKIGGNRERDLKVRSLLADAGWRQFIVWECALRGKGQPAINTVAERVAGWLRSGEPFGEIREA
jgi:DNA mismatch endonuclease (patch repair protein)